MKKVNNSDEADVSNRGRLYRLESAREVSLFYCMWELREWGTKVRLMPRYERNWDNLHNEMFKRLGQKAYMDSWFWPLPHENDPVPDILESIKKEPEPASKESEPVTLAPGDQGELF